LDLRLWVWAGSWGRGEEGRVIWRGLFVKCSHFRGVAEVASEVEHDSGGEEHGNAEGDEAALIVAGEVFGDPPR
jgi:hypothetical protein